jgi:hypothetical protein
MNRYKSCRNNSHEVYPTTSLGFKMKPEELIEDGIILDCTISDVALEHAGADTIFSLGNCTDARMCQAPNEPRVTKSPLSLRKRTCQCNGSRPLWAIGGHRIMLEKGLAALPE